MHFLSGMLRASFWIFWALLFSYPAAAIDGPHGGQIFLDGRSQYELTRDRNTGQVIFYALHAAEPLPDQISITLYSDPGNTQQIRLQSVTPKYEPYRRYESYDPGKISPSSESFAGIELSFGIGTFPRTLRSLG